MDQCRVDVDARVRYAWLELVLQLSLNPDVSPCFLCPTIDHSGQNAENEPECHCRRL